MITIVVMCLLFRVQPHHRIQISAAANPAEGSRTPDAQLTICGVFRICRAAGGMFSFPSTQWPRSAACTLRYSVKQCKREHTSILLHE